MSVRGGPRGEAAGTRTTKAAGKTHSVTPTALLRSISLSARAVSEAARRHLWRLTLRLFRLWIHRICCVVCRRSDWCRHFLGRHIVDVTCSRLVELRSRYVVTCRGFAYWLLCRRQLLKTVDIKGWKQDEIKNSASHCFSSDPRPHVDVMELRVNEWKKKTHNEARRSSWRKFLIYSY